MSLHVLAYIVAIIRSFTPSALITCHVTLSAFHPSWC